MNNPFYDKVDRVYANLLKQDVSEYETKTRPERLQRMDESIQGMLKEELANGTPPVDALAVFNALDQFVSDNGVAALKAPERLNKARAFFESSPEKLPEFYQMYCDARAEAWASAE